MKIVVATNAGEQARLLRQETRAFQAEMRKRVKLGGSLIQREAKSILASGSPLKRGKRSALRRKKKIGPLVSNVKLTVRPSSDGISFFAVIGPSKRAFYGRFHETGVDATVYIARSGARFQNRPGRGVGSQVKLASRFAGGGRGAKETLVNSYRFVLPKREWLITAAERRGEEAVAVIGDSFKVFQSGNIVSRAF